EPLFQEEVTVRWRDGDAARLDLLAVEGQLRREASRPAEDFGKVAGGVGPGMDYDEDRCRQIGRERCCELLKGFDASAGGPDDDDSCHGFLASIHEESFRSRLFAESGVAGEIRAGGRTRIFPAIRSGSPAVPRFHRGGSAAYSRNRRRN